MKFKAAALLASKGKTVVSSTDKYYIEKMGFLQEVGGTKSPSIEEFLGEWSAANAEAVPLVD